VLLISVFVLLSYSAGDLLSPTLMMDTNRELVLASKHLMKLPALFENIRAACSALQAN